MSTLTTTIPRWSQRSGPVQSLHAIGILARLALCDHCHASGATVPCVQSRSGTEGLHVARFAEARRRNLITAADLAAIIDAAGAFTASTVVYDDAFAEAA